MIELSRTGSQIVASVALRRQPSFYLDHCALADLARPGEYNRRLLAVLAERGELMLSDMNLIELASWHGDGRTRVRQLLDAVGPYFIPTSWDFTAVGARELFRQTPNSPCIDDRLLESIAQSGSSPTLSALVDSWVGPGHEDFIAQMKNGARQSIEAIKAAGTTFHVSDAAAARLPALAVGSWVFQLTMDQYKAYGWQDNDAFDLLHAVVPLAYANGVVLDKGWCRRAREIAQENPKFPVARAFRVGDLGEFLEWLEGYESFAAPSADAPAPRRPPTDADR